jgi:hypothetical protein
MTDYRKPEAIERVTRRRPRGARITGADFDTALFEVLVEEGFTYDSSAIGEFRLRWCRAKDEIAEPDCKIHVRTMPSQ